MKQPKKHARSETVEYAILNTKTGKYLQRQGNDDKYIEVDEIRHATYHHDRQWIIDEKSKAEQQTLIEDARYYIVEVLIEVYYRVIYDER